MQKVLKALSAWKKLGRTFAYTCMQNYPQFAKLNFSHTGR